MGVHLASYTAYSVFSQTYGFLANSLPGDQQLDDMNQSEKRRLFAYLIVYIGLDISVIGVILTMMIMILK